MRYFLITTALFIPLLFGCSETQNVTMVAWKQACAIEYKPEPFGQDYWQAPSETITLGTGDCEDKAILLWYTLRHINGSDAYFVVGVVHPLFSPGGHAWVEVGRGGLAVVLDPTSEMLQPRWMLSEHAYKHAPKQINRIKAKAFLAATGLKDLNTEKGW